MSGLSDLSQLLSLRSLREERARSAVSVASARLRDAERAVALLDAEIAEHDLQTGAQEQRFFEAMGMRPVSENELGRSRERLGISDQKREALLTRRDEAVSAVAECETELTAAQDEWRQRLFERDKLAEADSRLRRQEFARIDAAHEMEAEEMSADRVRLSC
ncbi:type III secretion system stalk subunit SctO [Rhizobium panacihumi]|uniref:type III secretion system stalk subunit SctO n=1 Tax=Rhizobium panacihumi TaxID=2008450 RepID=UPI003D7BCD87